MKRNSLKLGVLASAMALLAIACQPNQKEFKLTATGLPEGINGTYAKVYDINNEVIDSVLIQNGGFVYTTPADDTVARTIMVGETPIAFSCEEGEYTLTQQTDEAGNTNLVRGGKETSSFVKVQALNDEVAAVNKKYTDLINAKMATVPEGEEPSEELINEINQLQSDFFKEYRAISEKYYTDGGNTILDYTAFSYLAGQYDDAEYVEHFDAAGSMIKNDKDLQARYNMAKAAVSTSVGGKFVDYEIVNPAGESKMLSEFREEGKYFLLDFFASWCGPCKRSMPTLAEVEKQYSKILSSVSIAVWERDNDGAAYAEVVKTHKITWATMQDAQSKGVELYGVSGVPTFILFSPEGEVLLRGHDIDEVKAKLEELSK